MDSKIQWRDVFFNQLSALELHDILALRQKVFIIEQNCIFPEIDGVDPFCFHIIGRSMGKIVAVARLVPPSIDKSHSQQGDIPAIGRVVTDPESRGQGLGNELMSFSIKACERHFGQVGMFLNAQMQLQGFYKNFGFLPVGEPFLEDNIWHISMTREAD